MNKKQTGSSIVHPLRIRRTFWMHVKPFKERSFLVVLLEYLGIRMGNCNRKVHGLVYDSLVITAKEETFFQDFYVILKI